MHVQLCLLGLLVLQGAGSKVGLSNELESESLEITSAGLGLLQKQLDLSRNAEKIDGCDDAGAPAVFIVSVGRSGSTSIMHMLNQIPGFDLKGHNINVLSSLFEMYSTRDSEYKTYPGKNYYAWTRSRTRNASLRLCSLRTLVHSELNPSPHARVIGFKEVTWGFSGHLLDLDLLMQAFPNSKVIFSTRNSLYDQLSSMKKVWSQNQYDMVTLANKVMKKFSQSHPGRTFTLPLEDFSVENFNKLLAFLGEDKNCEFTSVFHDNAGPTETKVDAVIDNSVISCQAS
mmetsp:Transcript_6728/g.11970  ORF Transcript_6728/g.11970 Transcript_6728/m.11970 type:complete len:286 (+) Transcript_6728:121-978(+)